MIGSKQYGGMWIHIQSLKINLKGFSFDLGYLGFIVDQLYASMV